jgi:hypothetical protein
VSRASTLTATLGGAMLVASLVGACGSSGSAAAPAAAATEDDSIVTLPWEECQGSDQAWVRHAILAIEGRPSLGQAEVNAYEDIIKAFGPNDSGLGRTLVAESMMTTDDFRLRWSDLLADALHVVRIEIKSQESCYGDPSPTAVDDGALATWIRDHNANETYPGAPFTMHEVLSSSLELDDLSVLYRAHLFAMIARPTSGANLDAVQLETARRTDFAGIFDAAYIHRDLTCLECHNSQTSVTWNANPSLDRWWPVPGLFELSLFGASDGMHPVSEQTTDGSDFLRAHSMLRFDGVGNGNGLVPAYGWDGAKCGAFGQPVRDPLLDIDTYFGGLRGRAVSVWDLEASLHRGVDALARSGLVLGEGDSVESSDEAFAYLVAQNIAEEVWTEVIGTPLTIANYFARNEVSRDTLESLTKTLITSHFSLKKLLLAIVSHPVFNLLPPSAGCGSSAYDLPELLNPWTDSSSEASMQPNGVGDGVFSISARPLVRGLNRAMGWPRVAEYPADPTFEGAVGFFLKDAEPGMRGFDFQARLTWESAFGQCAIPPDPGTTDFISDLVARASSTPGATVLDAVTALKDRLVGDPSVDPVEEAPALEALIGGTLDSTDLTDLDDKLRKTCGVLVSSPQFLLGGTVPGDTRVVPKLAPSDISYVGTCRAAAPAFEKAGHPIVCGEDTIGTAPGR